MLWSIDTCQNKVHVSADQSHMAMLHKFNFFLYTNVFLCLCFVYFEDLEAI